MEMEEEIIYKYRVITTWVRQQIVEMTFSTEEAGAHLGGSLSMVELLTCLYFGTLKYDPTNPKWEERDRVILSKGHAALALYPVLAKVGIIEENELKTFKKDGSRLGGHPSLNGLPGIEVATGSLGQGLSIGVGMCLALKRKANSKSRVFVFLGDGECNEGSVWEAAASASHYKLNQLVAIIDMNSIQYDGSTAEIMNMEPLASKWRDFGWDVKCINGHDISDVLKAYEIRTDKPLAILAKTIKGKGISFMENNPAYHNAALNTEQYENAMMELEVTG